MADWVSPKEAARRLGITPHTVRSWVTKGWIKPEQRQYMPNGYLLVDFTALLTPRTRKRPRKGLKRNQGQIGVVRVPSGQQRADSGDDTTTNPHVGGELAGGGAERGELQRLHVGQQPWSEHSGREEAVGGGAAGHGQGGGTTAAAPEHSPEGRARTAAGGRGNDGLDGYSGAEDDQQGYHGEGSDIQQPTQGYIQLVVPSADLYASSADDDTEGDGDGTDSDVRE